MFFFVLIDLFEMYNSHCYPHWRRRPAAAQSCLCLPARTLSVTLSLSPCQLSLCAHYTLLPSLCPALYLYQYRSHLSINHLQGIGNYLCTCVRHTISAFSLINATLLIPVPSDWSHRHALKNDTYKHTTPPPLHTQRNQHYWTQAPLLKPGSQAN